jgi:rubrerythrin
MVNLDVLADLDHHRSLARRRAMPLLRDEPAGKVQSLDELFALAHEMEAVAARIYTEFAHAAREHGKPELAEVFERIAEEERGHAASVTTWSTRTVGSAPNERALRWHGPPTFDEADAAEIAGSTLVSPYRALSIAVRNEERAFAFWSYVASAADLPEVRAAAETMAREELEHVAAFRRLRRGAYHRARAGRSEASPRIAAEQLERRLEKTLREAARGAPELERTKLLSLAQEADGMADLAARTKAGHAISDSESTPFGLAEALAEAYLGAADETRSEDELQLLQQLAKQAVARLAAMAHAE